MMKNILLLTVILGALVFVQTNISETKTAVKTEVALTTSQKRVEVKDDMFTTPKQIKTQSKKELKKIEVNQTETIDNSRYVDDIFVYEDMDELATRIAPKSGIKPVLALSIEQGAIKSLEIGDTVVLPVVGGDIYYEMEITQKTVYPNNSISVDGTFTENGIEYTAILTEGESSSFVSMTTPQGAYEVEIFSELGYMYSVNDIQKVRIDPSVSDTIEVPQVNTQDLPLID
jgi:hypothetical protein